MSAEDHTARHIPTADELAVLKLWKDGIVWQDPRYAGKDLLEIVAKAMADSEFRSQLLIEPERVLREISSIHSLPEGVTLEFHENTAETLHVLLPPPLGVPGEGSVRLRDLLRSRTSAGELHFFQDDIDLGDWTDPIPGGGTDRGDQTSRDSTDTPPITLKE
jgi:hypothetical protein